MYLLPVFKEKQSIMPGDISTCRLRCRKYIQKDGYKQNATKSLIKASQTSLSIPEMQDVPLQELLSNESAKFHKSCKLIQWLKTGSSWKLQKTSFEKRQNGILNNDFDDTPENLELSGNYVRALKEKNKVAKEHCFFCDGKGGNHVKTSLELPATTRNYKHCKCSYVLFENMFLSKM